MADMTAIDQANATIFQAEQAALKAFSAAEAAFTSAINSLVTGLGSGGPQTAAKQFLANAQMSVSGIQMMNMANVYNQYGLNTDGTPVPTLTTTTPTTNPS